MSDVAKALREAKALVDTPEKWSSARDEHPICGPTYCAGMALERAIGRAKFGWFRDTFDMCARIRLRAAVYRRFGNVVRVRAPSLVSIGHWNDAPERTHADVMAAFDRAIALAEADE